MVEAEIHTGKRRLSITLCQSYFCTPGYYQHKPEHGVTTDVQTITYVKDISHSLAYNCVNNRIPDSLHCSFVLFLPKVSPGQQ